MREREDACESVKEADARTHLKLGNELRAGDKNVQASGNGTVSEDRNRLSGTELDREGALYRVIPTFTEAKQRALPEVPGIVSCLHVQEATPWEWTHRSAALVVSVCINRKWRKQKDT